MRSCAGREAEAGVAGCAFGQHGGEDASPLIEVVLRYAARTPAIAIPLAMMGLVGLLAYEFSVSLPVLAERSFHGGAEAYGFMTAAMGFGAVIGGLFTAARGRTGLRPMIIASVGFGAAIGVCAFAPFLGLAYAALLFAGWASVSFIAIGNSTIQLSAEPSKRGRVIALWQVAFQGALVNELTRGLRRSPRSGWPGRLDRGGRVDAVLIILSRWRTFSRSARSMCCVSVSPRWLSWPNFVASTTSSRRPVSAPRRAPR